MSLALYYNDYKYIPCVRVRFVAREEMWLTWTKKKISVKRVFLLFHRCRRRRRVIKRRDQNRILCVCVCVCVYRMLLCRCVLQSDEHAAGRPKGHDGCVCVYVCGGENLKGENGCAHENGLLYTHCKYYIRVYKMAAYTYVRVTTHVKV